MQQAKYAKRNDDLGLIYFYLKFFGLVALLLTVGIAVLYPKRFAVTAESAETKLLPTPPLPLTMPITIFFIYYLIVIHKLITCIIRWVYINNVYFNIL